MSRINTNVTALISARILNANNYDLNKSLERLSTGLRINRGADDPAGLITSENLRKQIRGTEAAVKNAERAVNIVSTAEGALNEVNAMLLDMQALLSEAANTGGMSTEEIDANQTQVDSIINSIDRISNSTEFEGIKLLNGTLAYTTTGVDTTKIADKTIKAAKLIDGASMTVDLAVTTSAQTGISYLSGATVSTQAITLKVGSNRGSSELTFAAGTTRANVVAGINAVKEITGVSAAASSNATTAVLRSVDFGTDAYVSVEVVGTKNETMFGITDLTSATLDSHTDYGIDVVATVNGSSATGKGKKLTISTSMLSAEIELTNSAALSQATESFTISSGGGDFAIGALVDAIGLEAIGIQTVSSSTLGNATDGRISTLKSGGTNSLSSANLYTAQRIVTEAIKDVSNLRGRLGSFQKNTLETTIRSLNVTKENLYAAESAIRDTDFATETSRLTRSQILVQSATMVLSTANVAPQNVLSLLS
ncbi:MAG: hypothetical protein AMJ79_02595 [Phycisphaerae bacterium SM23_30]|nr:MAG: hypothetical protein AMJ79_02595 [Phycisphaerae bacterium SM23_30]